MGTFTNSEGPDEMLHKFSNGYSHHIFLLKIRQKQKQLLSKALLWANIFTEYVILFVLDFCELMHVATMHYLYGKEH